MEGRVYILDMPSKCIDREGFLYHFFVNNKLTCEMSNSLYVYFVKAPLSMSLAFPSLESDTAITVITTTLTEE